jgi:hypothetical protein
MTLHWLPLTDNLKATSNLDTAATLLSPRVTLSKDSASKANILLRMVLEVMELRPPRLLRDNSHPVPVLTRKATSLPKPKSCPLFSHLEMRATALSLARRLG